ncbi:hypothetical protein SNE40_020677 [Patella caerulea]|uniref:G-protein coupled receptors family 1 profile domain-containing protein n=1 Tax=Patella caerulea TaxID=87958 RepID=A0AAN8PBJ0_PATCE
MVNVSETEGALTTETIPLVARVLTGVVLLVTMVISICGNFVVCYLVYRKPSMRSAINLLLAHIALADILLSALVMPFSFVTLMTETWVMNVVVCRLVGFLQAFLVSVGVFVLLAISADRYLIISQRREKLNLPRARVLLLLIWCSGAALTLPPVFGWTNYSFVKGQTLCLLSTKETFPDIIYVFLYTIISFFLPVALMFCAFVCIIQIVRKNGIKVHHHPAPPTIIAYHSSNDYSDTDNFQNIGSCPSSTRSSVMTYHRPSVSVTENSSRCLPVIRRSITVDMSFKTRAFKTIFILFVILVGCWTPFISMCLSKSLSNNSHPLVMTSFLFLGYIKCALNPIIYALRIKKFRDACKQIVPKWITSCQRQNNQTRRANHISVYVLNERSSI